MTGESASGRSTNALTSPGRGIAAHDHEPTDDPEDRVDGHGDRRHESVSLNASIVVGSVIAAQAPSSPRACARPSSRAARSG